LVIGAGGGAYSFKSKHFKNTDKNNKKNEEKTGIFTQNQFSIESILVFGVTLNQTTVYT